MRNSMQTRQGKVGHIKAAGSISLPGAAIQRARGGNRVPKHNTGVTAAKVKTRQQGSLRESIGIMHLVYGV